MKLLAHRGAWKNAAGKNSFGALTEAFASGYGVETDLRDHDGEIVISHDPAGSAALPVRALLAAYSEHGGNGVLALNVKSDGLSAMLGVLLRDYAIESYFCFDMSVPETIRYWRAGLRFFTRQSEFEPKPVLYQEAAGIWLDMFEGEWITPSHIEAHLRAGKEVALVSPELHGRDHRAWWRMLHDARLSDASGLMLCTDFPDEARQFFS